MDEKRYQIVFEGEIAYGFEKEETRANLRRLGRFSEAALDRLFSGRKMILKSGISMEAARQFKAALDRTGAVTLLQEMPDPSEKQGPDGGRQPLACPKCGFRQTLGISCVQCGIVFAKFQPGRAGQGAAGPEASPPPLRNGGEGPQPDAGYLARHQEQAFILKAFLVIIGIIFLKEHLGFLVTPFILLFPVFFLFYVRLEAMVNGRPVTEVLAQHITFMPVMYTEGERRKEGVAWVTYGLILVNILIFYGFQMRVGPEPVLRDLVFVPMAPNAVNVPLSLVSSMFLHAGGGHLWGNMLFLWALGTVVEKRIGWVRFLVFYFLAGIAASLLSVAIFYLFFRQTVHGLGASGAIAGAMGLFAVRCYFKSMVFPLPILGVFSLILPISLKIRLNSLIIIGLFFLSDLSGGIGQLTGASSSNIGHWAHIGGMFCGIFLGMMFKLDEDAIEERHQEIGSQALARRGDLYMAEDSLRLALGKNPENTETMVLLARLLSKFQPTQEGESLYRQAMDIAHRNGNMKELAAVFKEFYPRYLKGIAAEIQLRLAAFYHQQKDYEWAARCLEMLSDEPSTPSAVRERAIFQCAQQMELLGKFDIARHYYSQFVELFPRSDLCRKALARLNAS